MNASKDIFVSTGTEYKHESMIESELPLIHLFLQETPARAPIKMNEESDIKQICKEWGLKRHDQNDDDRISVQIPHTFDICRLHRKCVDVPTEMTEEDELKINEEEMRIVNESMCKYFKSGKKIPVRVYKYMKKRPDLMKRSLKQMRDSTEYSIENRVKSYIKKKRMKEEEGSLNINALVETINILNMDKDKSTMSPRDALTNTKNDKYIMSDDDEELLILIGFKKSVDLKSIKIRASMKKMDAKQFEGVSAPKSIFIFAVRDLNVSFDDLEAMQPDKDITTGLNKVERGQMIKLQNEPKNVSKFKKLKCLAIYIRSNHKETERTLVHSITLINSKPLKAKKAVTKQENKFDVLSVDDSD